MDSEQLAVLKGLHDRSWVSFDERRRHEYRFNWGIWAIYLAIIAGLLGFGGTGAASGLKSGMFRIMLFIFCIAIAVIHTFAVCSVSKVQQRDMMIADYYATQIRKALGIESDFTTFASAVDLVRFDRDENRAKATRGRLESLRDNWNYQTEALITWTLAIFTALTPFVLESKPDLYL